MLKKFLSLILVFAALVLCLTACSDGYEPIDSTEEEAATVMKFTLGEEVYEVKYELYRALFLTLKSEVDGGDSSVWQSAEKDEYINSINVMITKRLTDIYSVFSVAKAIGIDVYSDEYNDYVKTCVKASVDGGTIGSVKYEGFDGDYEKYLEALKEMYLNYSVQDLLIRYALALDDIYYYYGGNVENDAVMGKLQYTKEDVKAFYDSEECVRVYQLYLSKNDTSYTAESAKALRDKIAEADTEELVISTMIGGSLAGEDVRNSTLIAKHNLDSFYYSDLISAAFALSHFETSEVIEISSSMDEGYYILFRTTKPSDFFEDSYELVEKVYVDNEIGKILDTHAAMLLEALSTTEKFNTLDYSAISMD